LASKYHGLRERAYAATDNAEAHRSVLVSLRVQILEFAVECAIAVITASSGGAMLMGNAAERRAREAMFLQIQAQTQETRNAALARVTTK
jgi:hypothetical protein